MVDVEGAGRGALYAYHNADMEPQGAVGWVLDNFPQEIQYEWGGRSRTRDVY